MKTSSWIPRVNFIRIHYAWILLCSLLAFPVLYSYGNLHAVDAFFFGCSGSTESGLNTVDVKNLKTYQQVYLYIIPCITNLMFINAMVVPVRLYWFRQRLHQAGMARAAARDGDEEAPLEKGVETTDSSAGVGAPADAEMMPKPRRVTTITFGSPAPIIERPTTSDERVLRVPRPIESDRGKPIVAIEPATKREDEDEEAEEDVRDGQTAETREEEFPRGRRETAEPEQLTTLSYTRAFATSASDTDAIQPIQRTQSSRSHRRSFHPEGPVMHAAKSIEKVASSAFVLGDHRPSRPRSRSEASRARRDLPQLSRQVTIGRNSNFYNLSETDREKLGGIEYRALKLLLKFVFGYFFGLHLLGVVCLLPWIHNADGRYTEWLNEEGIGWSWWAIYSAQTMANNLGFTLTADSMATFKDATWPMLIMTFMAFAGNTCYPVFLRLCIWITAKIVPKNSQTRETLYFLLDHPRRCYTLLFPSRPTWILFGTVVVLNAVDVILIIVLDLDNPAVTDLPMGPRILSALFQAASARHTGTSTLNLAEVNPAVQFSLLTMMYISVFPIAISIRASNTFEERTLGIWSQEASPDERNGVSYIMVHIRNQLTFDLWYIFLGTFLICIAEAERIMDLTEPSFSLFPVIFEVTSAYGNVGLSLGGPFGTTSMSGHFTPFSKVVICAMMIRGRHRGLPYAVDRAITLPTDDTIANLRPAEDTPADGKLPLAPTGRSQGEDRRQRGTSEG